MSCAPSGSNPWIQIIDLTSSQAHFFALLFILHLKFEVLDLRIKSLDRLLDLIYRLQSLELGLVRTPFLLQPIIILLNSSKIPLQYILLLRFLAISFKFLVLLCELLLSLIDVSFFQ